MMTPIEANEIVLRNMSIVDPCRKYGIEHFSDMYKALYNGVPPIACMIGCTIVGFAEREEAIELGYLVQEG